MNARILVLFLTLVVAGGAAPAPAPTEPTLAGDPRLPADDIETCVSAEQWKILSKLKYRAVVILDGQFHSDGSMIGGKPRLSEPDDTWTEPARALAKKVRVKASSTGSHIMPAGEIFVIFYGQGPSRIAVVYGRQRDDPLPGSHGKARHFAIEPF